MTIRISMIQTRYLGALMLAALLACSGCAITAGHDSASGNRVMTEEQTALFDAAMAHINRNNYREGIKLLNQLTASTRKSAVPFINLAIAHKKQGELDKARKNLETALEIEPDNPVANNEYGLLLREAGEFGKARAVYEEIIKKYPNFALANKNLGVLCDIYLRDYPCALKAYRAYSAAVPDNEKARIWISDLEWRVKQSRGK